MDLKVWNALQWKNDILRIIIFGSIGLNGVSSA